MDAANIHLIKYPVNWTHPMLRKREIRKREITIIQAWILWAINETGWRTTNDSDSYCNYPQINSLLKFPLLCLHAYACMHALMRDHGSSYDCIINHHVTKMGSRVKLRRIAVLYNDQSNVSQGLAVIAAAPSRGSQKSGSSQQNDTLTLSLLFFFPTSHLLELYNHLMQ